MPMMNQKWLDFSFMSAFLLLFSPHSQNHKIKLTNTQTWWCPKEEKKHLNLLHCVITWFKNTYCEFKYNLPSLLDYKYPHHNRVTWKIACTLMCSLSWFLLWQLFLRRSVSAGFAGASLSGNETAGSIIRSDGKSLCKVFCIITYQSQNSHPQILWVTKHQQLPHYCPPKSSPTNDKERKKEEEEEKLVCLI